MDVDERAAFRALEESLWRPETRFDRDYMDRILAPDFLEFGRSGRTWTREETIGHPATDIEAALPLRDFEVHELGDGVALTTYVSEVRYDEVEVANRSSIWVRHDGRWRLRFHQGTPVHRGE